MERHAGSYALLQYSPVPERYEFLNVGIMLAVPDLRFFEVRLAKGQGRIDRLFDRPSKGHLQVLKAGFAERLRHEYAKARSISALEVFASKRANDVRLSPILSVAVDDPIVVLDELFAELVGDEEVKRREPRMAKRLRQAFADRKVFGFLEESPPKVDIPEAGIQISAPFGYQNGAYNLIDGLKVSANQNLAMQETGRRAIEGGLLWKYFHNSSEKKRLVVVGDFANQPNEFYHAVGDLLDENHVSLYRLDNLDPLIEDIHINMRLHN